MRGGIVSLILLLKFINLFCLKEKTKKTMINNTRRCDTEIKYVLLTIIITLSKSKRL